MEPPGRFLAKMNKNQKKCGSGQGYNDSPVLWYDVGDRKACEIASQCLSKQNRAVNEAACLPHHLSVPTSPRVPTVTTPTIPKNMSLLEWIQRARVSITKEYYVKYAVKLALELTNLLCLIVGPESRNISDTNASPSVSSRNESIDTNELDSSSLMLEEKMSSEIVSPFSHLHIEDIVSKNVVVSVASSSARDTNCPPSIEVSEVNIQPSSSKPNGCSFETPRILEQDVCFALGKILFELFAQGGPLLQNELDSLSNSAENFFCGLNVACCAHLPASKRSSISSPNENSSQPPSTKSMKANAFLREQRKMPQSICKLVSDLLEAEKGSLYQSDKALTSLRETQFDLKQMKIHPWRFLFDITCPTKALEKTSLFDQLDDKLYGRDSEMRTLFDAAARVSLNAASPPGKFGNEAKPQGISRLDDFLCEAVFLSGHSGSGKSSIINQLVSFCNANDWLVLECHFDHQGAPLSALLKSFDTLFGKFVHMRGFGSSRVQRETTIQKAFELISFSISSLLDRESFCQLCELLPNLSRLFPQSIDKVERRRAHNDTANYTPNALQTSTGLLTPCGVGAGSNRLNYLLHILLKALSSGGRPVAIVAEDLQWADASTIDIIGYLIQSASYFSVEENMLQGGLLLVGSFRDNEVDADGFLVNQIKYLEQSNINVNMVFVTELPEHEINKMLSYKFCLPMRYTKELARLVHHKTRGNPMYIVAFLRSIIKQRLITFSVKSRRWIWDDTSIDVQMISEGVVELLTRKLQQLPHDVIDTLKVVSCFGQLDEPTIELLAVGQFVPDMKKALKIAMDEGLVEKAGPIFVFCHDMLQESTYNLIPMEERKTLHKMISICLLQDPNVADSPELCTLAVDQINMREDVDSLSPVEKALFARLNLAAGKHAIAASSYQQARGYFEAGIRMLNGNCWNEQYSLSLELYEMSVVVCFMDGKVETVAGLLDMILSNVESTDDALDARTLRAKFSASQTKYTEATDELLDVLLFLGEEFPRDPCLPRVTSEMKAIQEMLKDVTKEEILSLPPFQDPRKLKAMKCMGLLISVAHYSSAKLMPLLSCRMIQLTFKYGFCEETIAGLGFVSHALLNYLGDSQQASRIGRIAQSLIGENQNGNSLRARLAGTIVSARCLVEPVQVTCEYCLEGYKSATIVGDVDNAAWCGMLYCTLYFYSIPDLLKLRQYMVNFFHQMASDKWAIFTRES